MWVAHNKDPDLRKSVVTCEVYIAWMKIYL